MKIGIGIDTGGTYTDSVVYDFEEKNVLFSSKALTTKEDLSLGIGNALDGLPSDMLKKAELVSLSTTLATNACVEEKGGRGKLIFIGGYKDVVFQTGQAYGLPDPKEILFIDGEINLSGSLVKEPDWDAFVNDCSEWIKDADAVAIVQHLGVRNSESERKAKKILTELYDINTICGHELFSDYNYIKRGASALLNARLIPVIEDFLKAIKSSLEKRSIKAPVVIVRSDGSLMSEKFTTVRPVETLLCGPAASVMGGIELTGEKDCLIIDMGGTTTDIAIVKNGVPVKATEGVNVGKWRTFVKAVYIDTFGLGGDSLIEYGRNRFMDLKPARAVPLCIAADRWPQVTDKLNELINSGKVSAFPFNEFFFLVKDLPDESFYSETEITLCNVLKNGPLIFSEAAEAAGKKPHSLDTERLEKEGIIMRCGLTPTDIMHIKGDFLRFDREASLLGAKYAAAVMEVKVETLCDMVYTRVKEKLFFNIARMLLEDNYPKFKETGLSEDVKNIVLDSFKEARSGKSTSFLNIGFNIPATLIGVGAPIHIFLPDVAKAFGTKYIIPENAGVANALGAIVGNISVTAEIEVKPEYSSSGIKGYMIFGKHKNTFVVTIEEAARIAEEEAKKAAYDEATLRGASGDIAVSADLQNIISPEDGQPKLILGTKISATAIGRVIL
ncbi:acetophenone carboxylase gamma subunit [Oxobacter pfennigii]|uniref:Acetophenone carboxylase gamma subunit n=1 Tax=Oxobacter pfennigii TaxID=36849 RepID=A0A0P9AJU3_9CLOT|nr:hydantoinase/oxoprolinase family protein [Oxobacter pfennigii]KPU45665.1 acetophenone carboxylase gamma subunit [Oxobacter pfennigii]